ncbi:MAG: hypothetical protein ABIM82_05185 [candidate division WOR-3 bacterium]
MKKKKRKIKKEKICIKCKKIYNPDLTFIKITEEIYLCKECFDELLKTTSEKEKTVSN